MKLFVYWFPVIVWMTLIFFLSSRESILVSDEQSVNFIIFKTLHVIEYFMLYVMVFRGFNNTLRLQKRNIFLAAFIVTVLYAAIDELHQQFVPTREGKVRDVIIDAFGATIAWHALQHLLPIAPKKLKNLAHALQII